MADIVDPQVTEFTNRARVDAEDFNQLQAYCRDSVARFDVIKGLAVWSTAIAADVIDDGRQAEGVTILTKNDVKTFMDEVDNFLAVIDAVGVLDIIKKPTVRPLRSRRGV